LAPAVGFGHSAADQSRATAVSTRSSAPALAIFNRAGTVADTLPAAFVANPVSAEFRSVGSARLMGTRHGWRYFAVPGRLDSICIGEVTGRGARARTGVICNRATDLVRNGAIAIERYTIGRRADVGGLALSGYTAVSLGSRTVPIRDNAFFLTLRRGAPTPMLTGPGLRPQPVPAPEP
jgi:hypothetical protein